MSKLFSAKFGSGLALIGKDSFAEFKALLDLMDVSEEAAMIASADTSDFWNPEYSWGRPYNVANGVLTIPVTGALLPDFGASRPYATGYDYIEEALNRGLKDQNVQKIALSVNSPGGAVSGLFELVDDISAAAKVKPIMAAAKSAYSAAYAVAAAPGIEKLTVARSGGVGSVGVVRTHVDESGALDQAGLKVTLIYSGDHKVEGNSVEPLAEDVKSKWQEQVDAMRKTFAQSVAKGRGLSLDAVMGTEADTYTAKEAIGNGFADAIAKPESAIAAFAASTKRGKPMTDVTQSAAVDPAALKAEGYADGLAAGVAQERARIAAILNGDEAEGRIEAAKEFAFETDLAADKALKILAKTPKVAPVAAQASAPVIEVPSSTLFNAAMARTENPNLPQLATDDAEARSEAQSDGDQFDEAAFLAELSAALKQDGSSIRLKNAR